MRRVVLERVLPGGRTLTLVHGNLVHEAVNAIVNAANEHLQHGGGVAGAIVREGGEIIQQQSDRIGHVATGSAAITSAGRLRARYVIHAVGPVYHDGQHGEPALLARAYGRSLEVAAAHGATSVAFPSISTGAYRFPIAAAARIALETVVQALRRHPSITLVRFVLFSPDDLQTYADALANVACGGVPADTE